MHSGNKLSRKSNTKRGGEFASDKSSGDGNCKAKCRFTLSSSLSLFLFLNVNVCIYVLTSLSLSLLMYNIVCMRRRRVSGSRKVERDGVSKGESFSTAEVDGWVARK